MKTKTTTARRVLALCMSVLMLMTAWVFVAPTKVAAAADVWDGTWDGSGFSNNHITSAKGFAQFINNAGTGTSYSGQTIYLDVDIDLQSINFGNGGGKNVYYDRNNYFQGTFDGQGHTISNFYMTNDDHRVGLFRSAQNATFKNVNFENAFVDDNNNNGKNGFAVLVGWGDGNLTFENVHIKSGTVYGYNYVGGLVGEYAANSTLTLTNCSNGARIYADHDRAAGMVGHSKGSVVATNCANTGEIYAGYSDAGGIAGWIEDDESSFTNCSNTGKVSTDACAGGIVGYFGSKSNDNKMTLNNCSNTGYIESRAKVGGGIAGMLDTDAEHSIENNVNRGNVYGRDDAGGIVGSNIGAGIWRNNKNYGNVSCDNDNAGGILGDVEDDVQKFYNCYNTGAVEGKNSIGGIFGYGQNANHEFYDCGNSGAITSTSDAAGGIFGYGNESEPIIEQCWNIGTVKAYNDAGGILGRTYHHSYIRRCWNAGSIETYNHNDNGAHGGIAGQTSDLSGSSNDNPNMTDCFNWGSVSGGRDDGGLIGKIKDGRTPYYITNSYNAGSVTGTRPFAIIAYGGNVGNNVYYNNNVVMGDAQGTGISENDLNNSAGFSGNYCKNTWGVSIGGRTYRFPILNWYRNLFMFHLKFQDAPSGTNVYWDGKYNSAFYAPNPTRRGYTTDHWFLTTDANKTIAIPTNIVTCGVTPCTDSLLMTQSFSEVTDVSNDSTFNLTWQKIKQKLDMNAVLNGEYKFDNINFFTADVYVNGTKVADDVNDFYQDLEFEDTYEITDIKTADGYRFVGAYNGIHDGRQQSGLTGQMDIDLIEVAPEFKTLHTVTVTPGTGTTITGVESGTYAWGDKVTVTATAETGYDQSAPVLKVNGNVTASGSEITITGDTTITTDALQLNTYTVNFYNGDPDTPYATRTYTHGDALVSPEDPTFSDGTDADYRFVGWAAAAYPDDGWDTEVTLPETVTANANYYSLYDGYVTVTWKNGNETLAGPASAMVGTVPVYDGETPTTADAQYTYTAIGWNTDPDATAALNPLPELGTSNVTYYAVYDKNDPDHRTVNKYTITWKNWDGSVLATDEVEYGATPVYSGPAPTRANDAQYTYGAYHWDPMIAAVSGEATYTAQFDYTVNAYTVTWKNWDGTVLETDEDVSYGTEPHFDGETPVRAADDENHYVFAGWDDASTVKSDKIITATFTPTAHVFDQQNTDAKYLKSGATCTDKALYYYSCSCGYKGTETFEYGEKLEHSFTKQIIDEEYLNTPASCTAKATYFYACSVCDEKGTETFEYGEKLPHDFTVPQSDDTYHWMKCANCDAIDGKEEHNFATKGDEVTPASCGQNATATYSCSCGKTTVKEVPGTALEHDFNVLKTDDTYHWYECANGCGEISGKEEHNFATKGDEVTPASCGHNATATYSCSCGKTTVKEVPGTALEHDFNVLKTDDTYHWYECANGCGEISGKEEHNFATKGDEVTPASCGHNATATYSCSCGKTTVKEVPGTALEHDFTVLKTDDTYHWYECANGCGEISGKEEHNFATKGDEVTPASCGQNATATYSCSCGKTTVKEVPGTALEHDFTVLKTDDTYHWYECANGCGEISGKEEHNFATKGDEVTPASCGHNATATYSCSCGKTTVKEVPGTALEHDFTVLKTDDTYHWYECANGCGEISGKEEHNFATKGDEVTPASCGHNATATYSCSCGKTTVKEVPGTALEHAFTVLKTDDTYHWYECANGCGTITDKVAHTGGTATCTEQAKCEVCNTAYGNFDYDNHSTTETTLKNAKEPGYTFKGYTGDKYCIACDHLVEPGTDIDKKEINTNATYIAATALSQDAAADPSKYDADNITALNAKLDELNAALAIEDNEAAVTALLDELTALVGSISELEYFTVTFQVDGETVKEETVLSGGSANAPTVDALVNNGENHKVFSGWTGDYTNVTADVTVTARYTTEAHSWIDGDVTKTPTCTEAGTQAQSCVCGATNVKTLPVDPNNHVNTQEIAETASTCQANGYTAGVYCNDCEQYVSGHAQKPLAAHSFTTYTYNDNATCTADGTETATCDYGCGTTDTRTKTGSKLGHDWGDWVITKNATCTEAGSKTRTCKNDSTHVETQAIAKTAHTDANGDTLCDVCGQPMANHQHTDVNGDGKCDTCGRDTDAHRHTDANGDNVCDNCGKTINTSFRCSMCDYNDQHRNTPVFGWFVIIIHFFVHLFAQMKAWV